MPRAAFNPGGEAKLHCECVHWFKAQYPAFADLLVYINNNSANAITGHLNRLKGTVAGFPDLVLFVPRGRFSGLAIEFKKPGEKPKPHQVAIHARLTAQGYAVAVVDSKSQFMILIQEYLAKS